MIREATKNDAQTIAGMAILMWDSHAVEDLADEFVKILSRDDAQIFLKYENDIPVGFAQCQLRHDYVVVSYTHLTLPTQRIVEKRGVAGLCVDIAD